MGRLEGKVAIVTGAASGMGAATAELFAEEGAKVVMCDVNRALGEAVAGRIGGDAIFRRHDIRSDAGWATLVTEVCELFGTIDILINNAAIVGMWAVRGLSRSLALELGPAGIRVCTLIPGGVNTPMNNDGTQPIEVLNKAYGHVPLQRIGEPIEVARAALFLASDEASYISGCELMVDGGDAAGYYQPGLPGSPAGFFMGVRN